MHCEGKLELRSNNTGYCLKAYRLSELNFFCLY